MILDSDVGFLSDPMNLIRLIDPKVDMYVQVRSSELTKMFSKLFLSRRKTSPMS